MLEKMKALAREKDICVLATVSGGKPYCSLMAYVTDEDCREIFMVTLKSTTKYANLTQNPSVSLLIDTREEDFGPNRPKAKALTISGTFQPLEEARKNSVRSRLLAKHPHLGEFAEHPDAEVFSIKVDSFLLLEGVKDAYFEMVD